MYGYPTNNVLFDVRQGNVAVRLILDGIRFFNLIQWIARQEVESSINVGTVQNVRIFQIYRTLVSSVGAIEGRLEDLLPWTTVKEDFRGK